MATDKLDLDIKTLLQEFALYENPSTEKQKAILEAAEKLFSEKGFDASPTAEIAKEANVTEKTLFKHFPSKNELLKRVLFGIIAKTVLPTQIRQVQNITHSEYPDFRTFAKTLAADRLAMAKKHGPKLRILILHVVQNAALRQQLVKIMKKHVVKDVFSIVEKFQKVGGLKKAIPAPIIVQVVVFTIMGYIASRYILGVVKEEGTESDLEAMIDAVLYGVADKS